MCKLEVAMYIVQSKVNTANCTLKTQSCGKTAAAAVHFLSVTFR